MSRVPDRENVSALRNKLFELSALKEAVKELQEAADALPGKEAELRAKHAEIITALEEMDCKASSNHGWEYRIAWMLSELVNSPPRKPA